VGVWDMMEKQKKNTDLPQQYNLNKPLFLVMPVSPIPTRQKVKIK